MVRRFANQVHKQASRLILGRLHEKEPRWFQAVLDHPPLPVPARGPAPRTDYDLPRSQQAAARAVPPKHPRPFDPKPLKIAYVEDELRRQFFEDHPFEAYRPKTLVEEAEIEPEHPIQGKAWTRLRQRGRNPSPEDAIKYAVNLHEHHGHSLNEAYAASVTQFRALRSERVVASHVALQEAEQYGTQFGPSAVLQSFMKEEAQFETWKMTKELDMAESIARKRWRMIVDKGKSGGVPQLWSRGQEYVRFWKESIRPTYSPILETSRVITPHGVVNTPAIGSRAPLTEAKKIQRADFMGVLGSHRQ
ncbi:37S ribosomal protein S25, mitochondrial [Phanerochaete sordida]|uniref:Small ribosomal subunit protein mS23 n=1 Tax=Phanerochaete sordida TaxID=48140 RepID=A0A9P3G480_9APHY|nr:37S ribosomal protein S25, mitochondrial [Phanerochaete sordida]